MSTLVLTAANCGLTSRFDLSPDQKLIVYDDSGPERDGTMILDTTSQSEI